MNNALRALVLSLLLHMLLWWGSQYLPKAIFVKPIAQETIEVDLINQPDQFKSEKTITREAQIPDSQRAKDSEDPLRFWSNQTQSVKQQTRAPEIGLTKNRGKNAAAKVEPQSEEKKKEFDPFAITEKPRARSQSSPGWTNEVGISTIGEAMPEEVTIGEFTSLNTDKFLYYSFFARVEDLIRYRWETGVRNAIQRIPDSQFQRTANEKWITQIEITLKKNGEYHRAQLMKPSGITSFDQAAIQSFVQARLFPNPPAEMANKDGYIRLKYSFQVDYNPTLTARRSSK